MEGESEWVRERADPSPCASQKSTWEYQLSTWCGEDQEGQREC